MIKIFQLPKSYLQRISLTGLIILFGITSSAQVFLAAVNFDQVRQKKVRDYISIQQENKIFTTADIYPTLSKQIEPKGFYSQVKTYVIKANLNSVWDSYTATRPDEAWEGKRVSFGVLISKPLNEIFYTGDNFSKIDTGQVVYLNLKLLKGIYNLALAFEIINIDAETKTIEFSYIEGNKSEGKQRLQFIETVDGITEIIHSSFFRSGSKLRDKYLYPFFHVRATNEFHRNMRKKMKIEQAIL